MNRRDMLCGSISLATMAAWPFRAHPAIGDAGWKPLFDGNSLDGWIFYQEGVGNMDRRNAVTMEDGTLSLLGPKYIGEDAPPGHISTKAEWRNYHLRLQFRYGMRRWAPRKLQRRNSGILYHMGKGTDRLFPDCVEFQLEEGDVGDAIMVNTLALQGPLLGGTPLWPNWIPAFSTDYQVPVQAGPYRRQWHRHAGDFARLDDWNDVDLYVFDDQAAHLVNGRIVNSLFKMRKTLNGEQVRLESGRIALEFEWAEVMFRNVQIRSLSETSVKALKKFGSD